MKREWICKEDYIDIETTITASFPMISLNADEVTVIISLMYQDKKNESGKILGSLLNGIGSCLYDIELSEKEIGESLFHLSLLAKQLN